MATTAIDQVRAGERSLRSRLYRAGGGAAAVAAPLARMLSSALGRKLERLAEQDGDLEFHAADATARPGRRMLLVSHDLSPSGAPILLLQLAQLLVADRWEVVLWSFDRGELAERFVAAGVPVVLDRAGGPGLRRSAGLLRRAFDAAICNTVVTDAAVRALSPAVPVIWYLHEVALLEQLLSCRADLRATFTKARHVWAGSELSAAIVRPHRPDVEVVPYGSVPVPAEPLRLTVPGAAARLGVFGSYEPRKGQDLLLAALDLLPAGAKAALSIDMYGRVLDRDYHARLCADAARHPQVSLRGELDGEGYRAALAANDAVVVPSRSDTLPLVSLDALGAGRVLMCTATTGTAAHLVSGQSGFVAAAASAQALADMLLEALEARARWSEVAQGGRAVFGRDFSLEAFAAKLLGTCAAMAGQASAPRT